MRKATTIKNQQKAKQIAKKFEIADKVDIFAKR